jgi:hypothetical protein
MNKQNKFDAKGIQQNEFYLQMTSVKIYIYIINVSVPCCIFICHPTRLSDALLKLLFLSLLFVYCCLPCQVNVWREPHERKQNRQVEKVFFRKKSFFVFFFVDNWIIFHERSTSLIDVIERKEKVWKFFHLDRQAIKFC